LLTLRAFVLHSLGELPQGLRTDKACSLLHHLALETSRCGSLWSRSP
jgi:hypothetical protein